MRHPSGTAASLALGILAILFAWLPFVALPAVLASLVLSRRAIARSDPALANGPALAARVCALIGFALTTLVAAMMYLVLQSAAAVGGHPPAPVPAPGELLW